VRVDEAGRLERPCSAEGARLKGGVVSESLEVRGGHPNGTAIVRQSVKLFIPRSRVEDRRTALATPCMRRLIPEIASPLLYPSCLNRA
jgi:hypothetical protein